MLLVKDIVNRVAGAAQLQLFQGHTQKAAFNQCFDLFRFLSLSGIGTGPADVPRSVAVVVGRAVCARRRSFGRCLGSLGFQVVGDGVACSTSPCCRFLRFA